jgi:hypothetical protein
MKVDQAVAAAPFWMLEMNHVLIAVGQKQEILHPGEFLRENFEQIVLKLNFN